jgi:hypothetical protein
MICARAIPCHGGTALGPFFASFYLTNLRDHPYECYRKLGFVIVGVIPDANGFGKPDIFMAKRLGPAPQGGSS